MRKTIQILKELRDSGESVEFAENFCNLSDDEKERLRESEKALDDAIKALENSSWIPVKTRKLSPEEIREFCENRHFSPDETDGAWIYECKLPDDNQDVLVSTKYGVSLTTFYNDVDYGAYFESYEEEGDVLAWMPLPEPYTKEDADT